MATRATKAPTPVYSVDGKEFKAGDFCFGIEEGEYDDNRYGERRKPILRLSKVLVGKVIEVDHKKREVRLRWDNGVEKTWSPGAVLRHEGVPQMLYHSKVKVCRAAKKMDSFLKKEMVRDIKGIAKKVERLKKTSRFIQGLIADNF